MFIRAATTVDSAHAMVAQRPPGSRPQPPSYLLSVDQHTFSTESPAELAQSPAIVGTWVLTSPGPSVRLVQIYNADGTMLSIHDEHGSRNTQLGLWTQT